MVICSETIETVSLSGVSRLQVEPNFSNKTFFARYKNRVGEANMSLHQYFHYIKNDIQHSSSQKEIDVLNIAENMVDITNTLENLENSGLNIGRNYDWGKRLFQVKFQNKKMSHGDSL